MPAELEELFVEPVLEDSLFVRFHFEQVNGRVQMKQFATDYDIGGYVKRIQSKLLICIAVFPVPVDMVCVSNFMDYIRALPQYHLSNRGISKHYSLYMRKPFEVRKTRISLAVRDDCSTDPDDVVSDTASINSYSSGTSSHI
jgi:hypothetical protein